ncbi:SUKH-3 domain-containing protein [Couchioplanes caeruleus]|nr:SUKH-3 domain-containing protein [Couchioplanes caeruleus]ROP33011.1 YwqJ-like deaminase [Couchioplanes caeruleus]
MITREDAEASAAAWARAESLTKGNEYRATVEEFDLGFIVTTASVRRLFSRSELGSGTTVIDRETGRVSIWPRWPSETVQEVYREQRATIVDPPRTADPEVQLRREARRRTAPGVAAHVTADGRVYIARGAKGDQKLHHHRLVLGLLAEQTPGQQVRGCERHAELIVCSDVLHDADRKRASEGLPPLTLADARQLLGAAQFERFRIREPGDPLGKEPGNPCESCIYVLTLLTLLPWAETGALYDSIAPQQPNPDPTRFPDELASEMLKWGWEPVPHELYAGIAEPMVQDIVAIRGQEHRHQVFPALFEAYGHTGSLGIGRRCAGVEQRSRFFEIFPIRAAYSADVLHEFGQVIGARLFPLGSIDEESILAIDERGRVFDLDQAGEWFVADTYLEALATLALGKRTYRVHDDGTWGPGTD